MVKRTVYPDLTATQTIVLACVQIAGCWGIEASLPEAEIILATWRLDPERFGLRGHRDEYPDSKRVACELSRGKRSSPLGMGWIRRIGPCMYRLTFEGEQLGLLLRKTVAS